MSCPNCPGCNSPQTTKVIASGLPMKYCQSCHTLWGEPWVTLYTAVVAPIEGFFNGGFAFYPYSGSYFKALLNWIKGSD